MYDLLIKNGTVFYKDKLQKLDVLITKSKIIKIAKRINHFARRTVDAKGLTVIPGLIDVHVHLREPGYEYKETILTGTVAAAAGGYTTVCCMPNTKPIIDNLLSLKRVKQIIRRTAIINVLPYASITIGQQGHKIVNIPQLAKACFAFSDDGVGVTNETLMKKAMINAKKNNKIIVSHSEDLSKTGNAIEYSEVIRNIKLAMLTKCPLHFCHISTSESIQAINSAKKKISHITFEVTPHHLLLNDTYVKNDGCFKVNPPLTSNSDQRSLINSLKKNVDLISTDHAPHSLSEKNGGFKKSLNGIVGLETGFALIYTNFVKTKIISLKRLIELMSLNSSKIFKIQSNEIIVNNFANIAIIDLHCRWTIDSTKFLSKGRSTPFNNWKVFGKNIYTICNGKIVYQNTDY